MKYYFAFSVNRNLGACPARGKPSAKKRAGEPVLRIVHSGLGWLRT